MHELNSLLINVSTLELYMFILGSFCFIQLFSRIKNFWFFLPHLFRAILGLIINRKLPKSHELVAALHFEQVEVNVGFDLAHKKIRTDMQNLFVEKVQPIHRYFKCYLLMTCLAGILDFINLIIVVLHYSMPGYEYEEMTMLVFTIMFWLTNLYWIGFVYLLSFKFPDYIQKNFKKALLGIFSSIDPRLVRFGETANNRQGVEPQID